MLEYNASTEIDASAERVWEILTKASDYPEWDPYCIRIEGTILPGAKIKAFTKLAPDRAFPVEITTFKPGKKMVWSGGMPLGLFKGERFFEITPSAAGGVSFTVREVFTGPLLPLFRKSLPDMNEPFAAFVQGLKERAESA